MSSQRKNFRRRTDDANGGATNGDDAGPPRRPGVTKAQTPPAPRPRSQNASRLSFADDEDVDDAEEGPFAQQQCRHRLASVRPASTASPAAAALQRITPAKDRARGSPAVAAPPNPSNFQSHAGEYTPERLRELQKNMRPLHESLVRASPPPALVHLPARAFPPPLPDGEPRGSPATDALTSCRT